MNGSTRALPHHESCVASDPSPRSFGAGVADTHGHSANYQWREEQACPPRRTNDDGVGRDLRRKSCKAISGPSGIPSYSLARHDPSELPCGQQVVGFAVCGVYGAPTVSEMGHARELNICVHSLRPGDVTKKHRGLVLLCPLAREPQPVSWDGCVGVASATARPAMCVFDSHG